MPLSLQEYETNPKDKEDDMTTIPEDDDGDDDPDLIMATQQKGTDSQK